MHRRHRGLGRRLGNRRPHRAGGRRSDRRDVVDVLVSDLQAQVPDHIAVTGYLVNLALEAEFAPALAWLTSVGPPDRVSLVPGNHDAYVSAARNLFAETWGSYLAGDDARDDNAIFPFLRRRGPVALIGVICATGVGLAAPGVN